MSADASRFRGCNYRQALASLLRNSRPFPRAFLRRVGVLAGAFPLTDDPTSDETGSALRQRLEEALAANAAANAAAAAANEQLEQLNRREVFRDAGLNPADDLHAMFMDSYKGELDVSKIREDPRFQRVTTPPEPAIPAAEAQAWDRSANAAPGQTGPTPEPQVEAELDQVYAQAVKEHWPTDLLNQRIVQTMHKHGLPAGSMQQ